MKLFLKKLLFLFLIVSIFHVAQGQTNNDRNSQIASLLKQIEELQNKLKVLQSSSSGFDAVWCYNFNENMKAGSKGYMVSALRTALLKEDFNIHDDGESDGQYFSEALSDAVSGFQQKYKNEILTPNGLQYGTGFVGKSTRAKLNQLYGCKNVSSLLPISSSGVVSSYGDVYITNFKTKPEIVKTGTPMNFTFELNYKGVVLKEGTVMNELYKILLNGEELSKERDKTVSCSKTSCLFETNSKIFRIPGEYKAIIIADPDNLAKESNEDNNNSVLNFNVILAASSSSANNSQSSHSQSSSSVTDDVVKKSRDVKRIANIKQIQIALEMYYDSNKHFPGSLYDLLGTYLYALPTDGLGNSYNYRPVPYGCSKNGPSFCENYHLGASLELKDNIQLLYDDDQTTSSPAGIDGSDENPCRPIGGGITRFCYDVVGLKPFNSEGKSSASSSSGGSGSTNSSIAAPVSYNIRSRQLYTFPSSYKMNSGSRQSTFASYDFNIYTMLEGNASDVPESIELSVNSIKFKYEAYSGGKTTDLTNCKIYAKNNTIESDSNAVILTSGANALNPYINGVQTINLDSPLIISRTKGKVIELKCDISPAIVSGKYKWSIVEPTTLDVISLNEYITNVEDLGVGAAG